MPERHRRRKPREWFETFFGGLYGRVLAGQFAPDSSVAQARLVKRLLGLRRGRKVLDIPCGMGRLTIPLAALGLDVTGLDLTPSFVRRARRQARAAGVAARFVQGDMRRIEFDGKFDAVVNWFTSFGYFSDEENLATARRMLRALRPGGRLVIETLNKSFVLSHRHPPGARRVNGGTQRTARRGDVTVTDWSRPDPVRSRMDIVWTLRCGRRRERRRGSIRMYSGAEMRRLLREAGFCDVQLFGLRTLHGAQHVPVPFTRHSARLIAVARRPVKP